MPGPVTLLIIVLALAAFATGWYAERWRAKGARRRWRRKIARSRGDAVAPLAVAPGPDRSAQAEEAAEPLRLVRTAEFERRRLLSGSEAWLFLAAEKAVREQNLAWRAMARVNLGEVLSSPDDRAQEAISSRQVDLLLVSREGDPIAAVEFQRAGEAVKKEALQRAGVAYIELTSANAPADLAREIARLAGHAGAKATRRMRHGGRRLRINIS